MTVRTLRLPDTLEHWPGKRRINPLCEEVSVESAAWLRSFGVFTPEKQVAFDECNFGLLASLSFPDADEHLLRAACDLMNLFFVFDEQTDVADEVEARRLADVTIRALEDPEHPRQACEPVVGEITRHKTGIELLYLQTDYVESVVVQARDRDEARFRNVDEYYVVRRRTVGAEPCCALAVLNEDLPLDLPELPFLKHLRRHIIDMVILDNDLLSYRREHVSGNDMHNVLTLVMHEKNVDLNAAVGWLAAEHAARMDEFLELWPEACALLGSCGSNAANRGLAVYLSHIANWPRANECWSFEGGRYLGRDSAQVRMHRVVEIEEPGERSSSYSLARF
ncbi:terpenoid synthase [Trametes polyzona]|nr:terpenoid synthase [Trametes polyzona]